MQPVTSVDAAQDAGPVAGGALLGEGLEGARPVLLGVGVPALERRSSAQPPGAAVTRSAGRSIDESPKLRVAWRTFAALMGNVRHDQARALPPAARVGQ
jgi:hypothetical protein